MFALEQLIIDRIKEQVAGLNTVGNPSVLAGVRDLGPLLPACLVIPGAGSFVNTTCVGPAPEEEQTWNIIILVPHQHKAYADGLTETFAGEFMLGIFNALHDWKSATVYQRMPFMYQGRDQPIYDTGYAEFPMLFSVKAALVP